jgi:hypothetical protein
MDKKSFAKRCVVAAALGLVLILQSTNAFARDRDDDRNQSKGRSREVVVVGHQRYDYHDGRFYRPGLFLFNIALGIPPFGAVVHFLPVGHRVVAVGGLTYYYYNNTYYKPCLSGGYVVVPDPLAGQNVVPAQNLRGEKVSINILNLDGSYTGVVLVKQRGGYVGPQGEFYPGNLTVEQLRSLYGR